MTSHDLKWQPPTRLVMIVGNYGSGKTEVSVNLALGLAAAGKKVVIADLDIVNPYFRSREAGELMSRNGIDVVIPPGEQQFADLPIVVPRVKAMLEPGEDDYSIFDVGGDDVGAKMLSSFNEALGDNPYSLLQVINSKRPFTDSVDGCVKMGEMIEESSRLEVSGYIVNSHLIEQTTAEVVLEGYRLAKKVSDRTGKPIEFVTAMGEIAADDVLKEIEVPVMRLERNMLPPWLQTKEKEDTRGDDQISEPVPAARVKPIFRP